MSPGNSPAFSDGDAILFTTESPIENISSGNEIPNYNVKQTRERPILMVTGYWPPTNEMLRHFSQNQELNPDGWQGENWRDSGFDVVSFGNASSFDHVESVVVDRIGDPDNALSVASVLGIRNVRSEPDSNLYLDISVLLGSQWLLPVDSTQSEETNTVWWDPWSWLQR